MESAPILFVIHLDTSVLVDALTGPRWSAGATLWTLNTADFWDIPGLTIFPSA